MEIREILEKKTSKELKYIAKRLRRIGFSKLKKKELIHQIIVNHQETEIKDALDETVEVNQNVLKEILNLWDDKVNFFQKLVQVMNESTDKTLAPNLLVDLNNKHRKRVLVKYQELKNDSYNFWDAKEILAKALPKMIIDPKDLLDCLAHIQLESGDDMAAYLVISDIKKLFDAHTKLATEFFDLIIEFPRIGSQFLPLVIEILSKQNFKKYYLRVFDLISFSNDEDLRLQAIYSLSFFNYKERREYFEKTIGKYIELSKESNESMGLCLIKAFSQLISANDERIFNALTEFSAKNSLAFKLAVARVLSQKVAFRNDEWFIVCLMNLVTLKNEDVENSLPIKHLLSEFSKNTPDISLRFYEAWLLKKKDGSFSAFKSSIHHLTEPQNIKALEKFITKWLLSGSRKLYEGASFLIEKFSEKNRYRDIPQALHFDPQKLNKIDLSDLEFLIRKLMGYAFFHCNEICSMVFSCLKKTQKEKGVNELVIRYFTGVIGYNYPEETRNFLNVQLKNGNQREKVIAKCINDELDNYYDLFKKLPKLKEFAPPIERIVKYNDAFQKMYKESSREAQEKEMLPIRELFHYVPLKFGKSSFGKIPPNLRKKHEKQFTEPMELHEHKISFSYPRLYHLDPLHLRWEILLWCTESRKQRGTK